MPDKNEPSRGLLGGLVEPARWFMYPFVIAGIAVCFIGGLLVPMDSKTASAMESQMRQLRGTMNSYPLLLLNDIGGALLMMVPFVGLPYAMFTAFLNGNYGKALSVLMSGDPLAIGTSIMLMPSTVLQFVAFGLAANESLILNRAFFTKGLSREARPAGVLLLAIAGLLALALALGIAFEGF